MKKTLMIFAAIVMMAGFSTTVMAQTSASVAATPAGATLIVPMTIAQTAALHFGNVTLLTTAGGTVVLPSNSTVRAFTGGLSASTIGPTATNAAYNVTGTYNETYALTLPATVTVTETIATVGVKTMTISALTARFNGGAANAVTSTLSAAGTDSFTVGGTLTVALNQIAGIYAGTFPVSVDYN